MGEVKVLESVQRLGSRMIPDLRGMSYEARCASLSLFTMGQRRLRVDLMMIYRTVVCKDFPDLLPSFPLADYSSTRGHPFKLAVRRTDRLPHVYRLSFRAVSAWNNLPSTIVQSSSLVEFKRQLDGDLRARQLDSAAID